MTSREDFIAAVRTVDERLQALRPRILEQPEAPLPEGAWRVRDALSHLAARSNGVVRVLARVEAASGGTPAPAPGSIDEINAGQVAERSDRPVEAILDEIRDGHQAAVQAVQALDEALLERVIPLGFRPGEASVADLLVMGGPRHDGNHLDQVEAALQG